MLHVLGCRLGTPGKPKILEAFASQSVEGFVVLFHLHKSSTAITLSLMLYKTATFPILVNAVDSSFCHFVNGF